MRKNTWLTAEDAFDRTVKERRLILSENEYLDLFYEMRRVFYCVIHYYREHVLKTIVDNNIKVDVFGDSWKDSLFYGHPNGDMASRCYCGRKYNNLETIEALVKYYVMA